jgi:hypothetical protein
MAADAQDAKLATKFYMGSLPRTFFTKYLGIFFRGLFLPV